MAFLALDMDKAFELSGEQQYPEYYDTMFFSNEGKLKSHDWGSMYITELSDYKVFKTKEEAFDALKKYIQANNDPLIPAINEIYITEVKPLSPNDPMDLKLIHGGYTYYTKNAKTNKWDKDCNPWVDGLTNRYTLQDFLR